MNEIEPPRDDLLTARDELAASALETRFAPTENVNGPLASGVALLRMRSRSRRT